MKDVNRWLSEGKHAEALRALVEISRTCDDPTILAHVGSLLDAIPADALGALLKAEGITSKRLAFLAGYTAEPLLSLVRARALGRKIHLVAHATEYGAFEIDIRRRDPELKKFAPDLAFFYVGLEHLQPGEMAAETSRWASLWKTTHEFLGCQLIQNTFEEPLHRTAGNFENKRADGVSAFVRGLNMELGRMAPGHVHFHDVDRLAAFHGRKHWRDEGLYDYSKIPVAHDHLLDYADSLVSVIAAIFGRSKKCLVLDLDNTLWGGVIGDDGVAGIEVGEGSPVGEAFRRFQRYLQALQRRGIVLAVCSKNDAGIAQEAFTQRRQDMTLRLEDFSAFVANWDPKHTNVARIATSLNLGLDSLVFVDDNPAEREIVRTHLPEVTVIDLPSDPAGYTLALSQTGLFETVALTEEDLARTEQYHSNARRDELLAHSAGDYATFLKSLDMKAVCRPFEPPHLARIAQLIGKTNQFNTTTRRYTEAQVAAFATDPNALTRYVRLRDKFGDNGLISTLIGMRSDDGTLLIDSWLMSCRVLKREVERFLFRDLLEHVKPLGFRRIRGLYLPTARNGMVEGLFRDLGFTASDKAFEGAVAWDFDLSDAAKIEATLAAPVFIANVSDTEYLR